jgi:hypothetical protein
VAFHLDGVIRLIRVPGQLTLTEGGSDDCGVSGTRGDGEMVVDVHLILIRLSDCARCGVGTRRTCICLCTFHFNFRCRETARPSRLPTTYMIDYNADRIDFVFPRFDTETREWLT